jgi:hypothetical protein
MKLSHLSLGIALALFTGCTGSLSRTPKVSLEQGINTATVQTPHGPMVIWEQPFDGSEGLYPWDLHLWQKVSEPLSSRAWFVPGFPVQPDLERVNETLSRFDYILRARGDGPGYGYDLYRRGKVFLTNVLPAWPVVAVNEFGDDFALVLRTLGDPVLLRRQGVIEGDWAPDFPPVFVGKDLVALQVQYPAGHILPKTPIPWSVWREGKRVFNLQVPEDGVNPKIKRLAAWDSHWILEVDDTVYVDGRALAAAIGARQVFEWRLVNGKPFYFAEIGHRITPSFGGVFLPLSYDQVVHYQCCEPAFYNPRDTKTGVSFWGRRGRRWYFVLIDAKSR